MKNAVACGPTSFARFIRASVEFRVGLGRDCLVPLQAGETLHYSKQHLTCVLLLMLDYSEFLLLVFRLT